MAQQSSPTGTENLQKEIQNELSDFIRVPFQNNINSPIGAFSRTQNYLNIQPVLPFRVTQNWNLVIRTILPVISQPDLNSQQGRTHGLSVRRRNPAS